MDIYTISNWMTCFVEALCTFVLFEAFLKRRIALPRYIYAAGVVILAIFIGISNSFVGGTVSNALVTIILSVLASCIYSGELKLRILSSALRFMIGNTAEMIVLLLLSAVLNKHVALVVGIGSLRLLGIVLSKALEIAGVVYIYRRAKKDHDVLNTGYWLIFTAMFTFTTFMMLTFYRILLSTESQYINNMIMLCAAGLCVITVFIMFVYERTLKQQHQISQQRLSQIQMKNKLDHYNAMIMSQNQIKGMRHDLKNHLISMSAKLDRKEYEECLQYINKMLHDVDMNRKHEIDTGNTVLDAILNAKMEEADKKRIDFRTNITIPSKLPINEDDICIIFGNALDNAIEACEKVEKNPYISLAIAYKKDAMICRIENTYNGLPTETTTKKDITNHGIGRSNIEKALSNYNGVFDIKQDDNKYVLSFVLTDMKMSE